MRVATETVIVETINGNETSAAVAKMEDLLVEDGNVTLTIRLIMQGKVSVLGPCFAHYMQAGQSRGDPLRSPIKCCFRVPPQS